MVLDVLDVRTSSLTQNNNSSLPQFYTRVCVCVFTGECLIDIQYVTTINTICCTDFMVHYLTDDPCFSSASRFGVSLAVRSVFCLFCHFVAVKPTAFDGT